MTFLQSKFKEWTPGSLSALLFYLLPEKVQYCNIIAYFLLFISFLAYFLRVVSLEKIINKTKKIKYLNLMKKVIIMKKMPMKK